MKSQETAAVDREAMSLKTLPGIGQEVINEINQSGNVEVAISDTLTKLAQGSRSALCELIGGATDVLSDEREVIGTQIGFVYMLKTLDRYSRQQTIEQQSLPAPSQVDLQQLAYPGWCDQFVEFLREGRPDVIEAIELPRSESARSGARLAVMAYASKFQLNP